MADGPTKRQIHARANEIIEAQGWGPDVVNDPDFRQVGGGMIVANAIVQAKRELSNGD